MPNLLLFFFFFAILYDHFNNHVILLHTENAQTTQKIV